MPLPFLSKGGPHLLAYLVRRFWLMLLTLLGASMAAFILLHLSGNPAVLMLSSDATPAQIAAFSRAMGFDQPLWVQYFAFLGGALHGSLGTSLRYDAPALSIVLERVPATFALAGVAFLFMVLEAVPLGILSAVYRNRWLELCSTGVALMGQAVPGFFLAIFLILLFSVNLHWLPPSGENGLGSFVMPAITLSFYGAAPLLRLVRSAFDNLLSREFVRTAQAKGLPLRTILLKHVLKNAMVTIVGVLGVQLGVLLGGSVITETVFGWPGMGRLLVQEIGNRDYPVVQAAILLIAVIFIVVNFLVDVAYVWLDPTVSYA